MEKIRDSVLASGSGRNTCLILGDNFDYGHGLSEPRAPRAAPRKVRQHVRLTRHRSGKTRRHRIGPRRPRKIRCRPRQIRLRQKPNRRRERGGAAVFVACVEHSGMGAPDVGATIAHLTAPPPPALPQWQPRCAASSRYNCPLRRRPSTAHPNKAGPPASSPSPARSARSAAGPKCSRRTAP